MGFFGELVDDLLDVPAKVTQKAAELPGDVVQAAADGVKKLGDAADNIMGLKP